MIGFHESLKYKFAKEKIKCPFNMMKMKTKPSTKL